MRVESSFSIGRTRGWWDCGCALALLVVLATLVPLAQASPPDPVWIGGIYDAADGDDAILAVTSLESRVEEALYVVSPVQIVAGITPTASSIVRIATLYAPKPRAPPNS